MKFGSHLKSHRTPHWRYHFVDYDGLKNHLKTNTNQREFTDQDEAHFIKLLRSELDKVASFQDLKLGEVLRRTDHCEHTIQQHQMPSAKSSEKLTLASFVVTESEINKITQDVQDLARFQRLNYTAFLKIIKKHDKHTSYVLRSRFMNVWLEQQPFHKESFAPLVGRLSTLYNIVRTGNAPVVTKARSIDSSEEEEVELGQHPGYIPRKTAYWVHPDSIMDLKMLILKYLPLVVYEPIPAPNSSHRSASSQLSTYLASESPVSTVYLDSPDLDLYMAQVEQRESTETVRLRWYGSECKQVWVEQQQRKHASPALSPSANINAASSRSNQPVTTKHRFQIKAKHVPNLLQGTAKLEKVVEQMRLSSPQKSKDEMQQFEDSTRRVQSQVHQRGLQPVVQTFFNRTAFQVPGDARVRITIDTDVVMVREWPIVASDIYTRPWNPTDLRAENYPFTHVREQDIVRFPFAVVQIKTLTEEDEETPAWVDQIAQSPLMQVIPNFSKDLHAIATLYEERVRLLPFWLSEMDRDLRKSARLVRSSSSSYLNSGSSNSGGSSTGSSSSDTLNSNRSTTTTTTSISDSGLSRLLKKDSQARLCSQQRARQSILDPHGFFSSTGVTFEDEVLHELQQHQQYRQDLNVHRLRVDSVQGIPGLTIGGNKKQQYLQQPKSCLKKHGSVSSLQSRNTLTEDDGQSSTSTLARHNSYPRNLQGYGALPALSPSGSTTKGTQENNLAHSRWSQWIPFYGGWEGAETDVESQMYGYNKSMLDSEDGYRQRSDYKAALSRLFWIILNGANVVLLFGGIVLTMMNVSDGMGMVQACLFLFVTCLCMGSTVWMFLNQIDIHQEGADTESEDDEVDETRSLLNGTPTQTVMNGHDTSKLEKTLSLLTPERLSIAMFLCLSTTVALSVMAHLRSYDEEAGDTL
ncbi:hypothetical protein BGZ94_000996 [Podila epigama]|nr:hypothetical protein BGZ94_000996 [Podila epigama]